MLFALAFLPMFGIGGLTGLPLGLAPADIHLHDTYYVIGHFHYVVAPGTMFALFAGIYYWFPKVTGRQMNELLGTHALLGIARLHERHLHADVHPGLAGVNRRLYDGGASRTSHNAGLLNWNVCMSWSAWALALSSCSSSSISSRASSAGRRSATTPGRRRRSSGRRRRRRRTAIRDGAGGVSRAVRLQRAGRARGLPAAVRARQRSLTHGDSLHRRRAARHRAQQRQARHVAVPGVGGDAVRRAVLAYVLLRIGAEQWPRGYTILNVPLATFNTVVLISSSMTMVMAWASLKTRNWGSTACTWP